MLPPSPGSPQSFSKVAPPSLVAGSEANGKVYEADDLEIWTQDAKGVAARVKANTPLKQILVAHALLARPAKKHHRDAARSLD